VVVVVVVVVVLVLVTFLEELGKDKRKLRTRGPRTEV
jgi:hypothetical protein